MAIAKCIEVMVSRLGNQPLQEFDIYLTSGCRDAPTLQFAFDDMLFEVRLDDLLEEALTYQIEFDYGEGTHKITKLLREYADKMDSLAEEHQELWGQ